MPDAGQPLRLSELIGALSYALDVTEGPPPGHRTRGCLILQRIIPTLKQAEVVVRSKPLAMGAER